MTAAALAGLLGACGGGGGMDMPAATAMGCMSGASAMGCMMPSVTLRSPGATVHLSVALSAEVGGMMMGDEVMEVDFMVDGERIGSARMPPFRIEWDSTAVGDGPHTLTASVMDSMDRMASSPPVAVSVDNNPSFTVSLAPAQILPVPATDASGTASLVAHLATGAVAGRVMLSGMSASAVTLNQAFAGDSGAALATLGAGAAPGEWDLPAGARLTAAQVTALLEGRLYLIASSAAHPGGEIRGQLTPQGVLVIFAAMDGAQEVPPVAIAASGTAAVTVDRAGGTLTVHVRAAGLDDAMSGAVDNGAMGATGSRLAALEKDPVDPGHWSLQLMALSAADLGNFEGGRWYVNLATATEPSGAIRGQIEAPAH